MARPHFHIVVPSTEPRSSQTPVVIDPDRDPIVDIPHNYKLRSILQDQTNPASDDPSPHLSKAVFFPWTRSSIRTLWGGGRATRMPWRGASEDQPPEERWDRVVVKWKDCMAVCAGNQLRLVHTRGNKLREIMALTIREDERLRTVTWALEFDTLHPLVCVGGDTGIIHVFNVESWEMIGAMTGHGGRITHLTTHKIRPDYILSSSHDYTARMWSLADPVDVPTMPVFWPGQKKVQTDTNGDWGFGQMAIGPSERPHFIPVDALVMRTGPPGGVPDPEQAGKGKGACIAVFKGAGSLLGGHDSWVMHADFHPTRPFVVTCGADRAVKIWRVPDFPTPETRPERGVNYHIVERPLFSCTHLHETGVEYVSWLKEDVLVSISSNFPRIHAGDEEELDDKDRIDVSGTIVVWQWLDLNRFAPEGAEIKEHLVKPSYWDWTESRSYLTLSKIFLFDEEEYSIHTSWTLSSNFGSPLFLLTNRGNRVHVVDIQKYNQSPEEVKSRMKDPEIRAARRGNRREVRYGNRVELKDVPRAQLYAGNSSQSYSILGAVQNPHSPGMIIGLGKDGLLMLWRDGGLRPWSEGVGLGA
ncbi:WD domain, G-beta repeat, partial [Rhizoctonia solani]